VSTHADYRQRVGKLEADVLLPTGFSLAAGIPARQARSDTDVHVRVLAVIAPILIAGLGGKGGRRRGIATLALLGVPGGPIALS
jgi:hypothetical protein